MLQSNDVLAQYEANNVPGRGPLDPRKGIYKIISTYQGTCYGKPAQMASANWKESVNDSYSDEVFTIQLESFKVGCDPMNTTNLSGREINVISTTWYPQFPLFTVKWAMIPDHITRINALNSRIKDNPAAINLEHLLDFEENWEDDSHDDFNDLGDY